MYDGVRLFGKKKYVDLIQNEKNYILVRIFLQ